MKNDLQLLLRMHGVDHVVDYLQLKKNEKNNLLQLKYDQINADWSKPGTTEARGIIFDKEDNFNIVSYPYKKFFNITEGYCDPIDWNTADVYEKADGSLINLYYYQDKWNVQTSGTIDADCNTNNIIFTFADLFWYTVKLQYGNVNNFIDRLDKNYNYMFELCTPYNIIVTPHKDFFIKLHGVRDMRTYNFIDINETDLDVVKKYKINSLEEINEFIKTMEWMEEGFVVSDINWNRAKIKNPKYVSAHHVATKSSPYAIMNVIKSNEIDEFLSYFKHHEEEVLYLKEKWDEVKNEIQTIYDNIKHIEDQKDFALKVKTQNKRYHGILFALRNNYIKDVHEGMCRINDRDWYLLFNKK